VVEVLGGRQAARVSPRPTQTSRAGEGTFRHTVQKQCLVLRISQDCRAHSTALLSVQFENITEQAFAGRGATQGCILSVVGGATSAGLSNGCGKEWKRRGSLQALTPWQNVQTLETGNRGSHIPGEFRGGGGNYQALGGLKFSFAVKGDL